jgi:hypothetical protein
MATASLIRARAANRHPVTRTKKRVSALIPGVEVGIRWIQFEEQVPEDITGFRLDRVTGGTRVRVVDFATPEDADALQALWTQRLSA